jgi:hypothetical protein
VSGGFDDRRSSPAIVRLGSAQYLVSNRATQSPCPVRREMPALRAGDRASAGTIHTTSVPSRGSGAQQRAMPPPAPAPSAPEPAPLRCEYARGTACPSGPSPECSDSTVVDNLARRWSALTSTRLSGGPPSVAVRRQREAVYKPPRRQRVWGQRAPPPNLLGRRRRRPREGPRITRPPRPSHARTARR